MCTKCSPLLNCSVIEPVDHSTSEGPNGDRIQRGSSGPSRELRHAKPETPVLQFLHAAGENLRFVAAERLSGGEQAVETFRSNDELLHLLLDRQVVLLLEDVREDEVVSDVPARCDEAASGPRLEPPDGPA